MKKMSRDLQKAFEQNLPQHALDWINELMRDYEEKCREYYELKEENRRLQDRLFEMSGMFGGQRGSSPEIGFRPRGEHYPPEIYGREGYGNPYPNRPPYYDDFYNQRRGGRGTRSQGGGGSGGGQGGGSGSGSGGSGGTSSDYDYDWPFRTLRSQRENPERTSERDIPNE